MKRSGHHLFSGLLLTLLSVFAVVPAQAIDPPEVDLVRISETHIRVGIPRGVRSSGYNIYLDNKYLTTARPSTGSNSFEVKVGGAGGAYCVVAFETVDGRTSYSRCSAPVAIQPATGTPDTAGGNARGLPTAPPDFRVVVYSPGVIELFWNVSSDNGRVIEYVIERDGVELLRRNGRSYFESRLDVTRTYRYAVSAIDNEGNEGPASLLDVNPVVGGVGVPPSTPTPPTVPPAPPSPPTGTQPPAPPGDFRGVAYSPGVVEVFWSASPDEARLAGYELRRDGVRISFDRGRSEFQTRLQAGRIYNYELSAVLPNGARSAPLTLSLQAGGEAQPAQSSRLIASPVRATLKEGDRTGSGIDLTIQRAPGNTRAVSLQLVDESGVRPVSIRAAFFPEHLAPGETRSRLVLTQPVDMAPIRAETRRLRVRADDGITVSETPLTIDITPTDAPDVYLLIGQSNMEGYSENGGKRAGPGQLDEPVERVRQLHVEANLADIFVDRADFVSESVNISTPQFIRAEDPLHDLLRSGQPGKAGTRIGPSLSFGKAALTTTTSTVYLVPAAWGATGFCARSDRDLAWNARTPTDPALGGTWLLDRALVRLNMTLRDTGGILRGILWHQGGADSNVVRCAERYADNIQQMIKRLRREARVDARGAGARGDNAAVPFVLATQSRGKDSRGDFSVYSPSKVLVDSTQRNISSLVPYADVVINDDLIPPAYPCGRVSCVHFGSVALREQGVRFHEALQRVRQGYAAERARE